MKRATRTQRGYDNRWLRYRRAFLAEHPLCAYCLKQGLLRPATVVDHVTPHKGDKALFWDETNHQALCKRCHDSVKAAEESRGYDTAVGIDGWPIDPRHPANRD